MRDIKFRCLYRGKQMYNVAELLMWKDGSFGANLFIDADFAPDSEHCSPLMEYIGKQDKNCNDIYESDIVKILVSDNPANVCQGLLAENKVGKEVIGYIDYAPLYCQFRFTTNGITYLDLCCGAREIEVIGNIYQHPHLLQ